MLSISEIDLLSPVIHTGAHGPGRAQAIAAEFDALVLELFLKQGGILQSFGNEEGAQLPLVSEMFLQSLARELAAQIDLGFGGLLVNRTDQSNAGGKQWQR